jgi:hypothetical protein
LKKGLFCCALTNILNPAAEGYERSKRRGDEKYRSCQEERVDKTAAILYRNLPIEICKWENLLRKKSVLI